VAVHPKVGGDVEHILPLGMWRERAVEVAEVAKVVRHPQRRRVKT
jgi:hypothetical protein